MGIIDDVTRFVSDVTDGQKAAERKLKKLDTQAAVLDMEIAVEEKKQKLRQLKKS